MSDLLPSYLSNFWPAVALAIGFPLVLLALNEAISVCRRRGFAVVRTLRNLRNLVVPAAAILVFVRFVLEWTKDSTASRLVESAFWILLLYTLLGVVNDLIFGRTGTSDGRPSWSERVPKLFRDLVRALLVAIGAMVVAASAGALTTISVTNWPVAASSMLCGESPRATRSCR